MTVQWFADGLEPEGLAQIGYHRKLAIGGGGCGGYWGGWGRVLWGLLVKMEEYDKTNTGNGVKLSTEGKSEEGGVGFCLRLGIGDNLQIKQLKGRFKLKILSCNVAFWKE